MLNFRLSRKKISTQVGFRELIGYKEVEHVSFLFSLFNAFLQQFAFSANVNWHYSSTLMAQFDCNIKLCIMIMNWHEF